MYDKKTGRFIIPNVRVKRKTMLKLYDRVFVPVSGVSHISLLDLSEKNPKKICCEKQHNVFVLTEKELWQLIVDAKMDTDISPTDFLNSKLKP